MEKVQSSAMIVVGVTLVVFGVLFQIEPQVVSKVIQTATAASGVLIIWHARSK
ncbi:MAG: hypothetical protein M1150_04155 [Patescibacteria group bacterium]|nr:hypothetical protein [Patescibacteria group bacterium]